VKLVVASTNRGKLREISLALSGLDVDLVPVDSLVPGFAPEETGATFLENAAIKAQAAFDATGLPCVADDSGLCVHGLGLEPGVRSSRYAGDHCTDAERIRFLLDRMHGITGDGRRAYFSCTVAAVLPSPCGMNVPGVLACGHLTLPAHVVGITTEGRLPGTIGLVPRGGNGFGYDPLFHPDADPSRTLAEFGTEEKNRISHRGQAFALLARVLARNLHFRCKQT
jgi:XTP/dITP diphosphohydrolase